MAKMTAGHKPGMMSGCSGHYGTGGPAAATVQTVKTKVGAKR
jgi:hypothetical protein